MLGRTHRFHGQRNLRRVYKEGQNARGSLMSLRYLSSNGRQSYRVAVVVSRQVSKSAVVRNRIRRRVYAQLRQAEGLPPDADLVFTVYSDKVAGLSAEELAETIGKLLQKA